MKNFVFAMGAAAVALAIAASPATASPITTAAGTDYAFPVVNYSGAGPQTFGPGITWSSTNANYQGGSVFGYNYGYGFSGNGFSSDTLVGLNDSFDGYDVADTMRFDFAAPVSSVGAVLNWVPNTAPVTIATYDVAGNLLESTILSVGGDNLLTPNSFYGFQDVTADIASFRLTDGYVAAIGSLNVAGLTAAVPEPSTWATMIVGVGAIGGALRRTRRRRASTTLATA